MKTTAILAAAVGFLSTGVNAGCYNDRGLSWGGEESLANWHIGRACRGYDGKQGAFQGVFGPGQTKYACIQVHPNQKWEFWIRNNNGGASFDLADNDCTLRLGNEVNGCTWGGESTVSGWFFRSDPNVGNC